MFAKFSLVQIIYVNVWFKVMKLQINRSFFVTYLHFISLTLASVFSESGTGLIMTSLVFSESGAGFIMTSLVFPLSSSFLLKIVPAVENSSTLDSKVIF